MKAKSFLRIAGILFELVRCTATRLACFLFKVILLLVFAIGSLLPDTNRAPVCMKNKRVRDEVSRFRERGDKLA